jgi:hypothetical protein
VATATGCRIRIEPGLAEGPKHRTGWLPSAAERFRYFPELDLAYEPVTDEPAGEWEDGDVVRRCVRVAELLGPRLVELQEEGAVVVVSHASVVLGLAAALVSGDGADAEGSPRRSALMRALDDLDDACPAG